MSSTTDTASPTSSTPFFTNSATATSGGGGGGGGGINGQSTPLYLFTFLATLFVLLFVSSAIVLRSFFLRRRFRRRIEEAIAAGVLIAPPGTGGPGIGGVGSRRRDFGEKPKLWDADACPAYDDGWDEIMPITAKVPPKYPFPSNLPSNKPKRGNIDVGRIVNSLVPSISAFRRTRNHPPSPKTPNELSSPPEPPLDPLMDASEVQVSVLVSMPNPDRPRYHYMSSSPSEYMSAKGKERSSASSWEDEGDRMVPDVVVGVTQVPLRHVTQTASPAPPTSRS